MKVIIKKPDGKIRILHPAPGALERGLSLEDLAKKALQPGETWELVEDSAIPAERYFRNAWSDKKGKIEVNVDKAAAIKMDNLRIARNEELAIKDGESAQASEELEAARLDLELVRSDDPDKTKKEAELKKKIRDCQFKLRAVGKAKQALRDIPQTIDLKKYDLTRMKNYVPKELVHRTDVL